MGWLSQRIFSAWYDLTDPHRSLRNLELPQGLDPNLAVNLMKHQKIGVAWLHKHRGRGVILADDMGLGKTLQALAYLDATKRLRRSTPTQAPALVVCPPTLLGNWAQEVEQWTPNMRSKIWLGPKSGASLEETAADSDVVLVSYDTLRRHIAPMCAPDEDGRHPYTFDTVIFDEAQLLKNPSTRGHRAARDLPAKSKMLLTGTPIENSIGDLYSLLSVVNPELIERIGLDKRTFVARYRHRLPELREITREVILSRDKKRLRRMLGLPKKTVEPVRLTMDPAQRAIYQQVAAGEISKLLGLQEEGGFSRPHLFAMINQLKQVCNDPQLLGIKGPSVKKQWLKEKLEGWEEPVIVFTQYTRMMPHLTDLAQSQGYETYQIHGQMSPAQRTAEIARWKQGATKRVIVISLRAGGVGINLPESRLVVHYDRWWNPAVEDQASDRSYRMGQKRDVIVFTPWLLDTLEQNIDNIQTDKRALSEAIEKQDVAAIERMVLAGDVTAHMQRQAQAAPNVAAAHALTPAPKIDDPVAPPLAPKIDAPASPSPAPIEQPPALDAAAEPRRHVQSTAPEFPDNPLGW